MKNKKLALVVATLFSVAGCQSTSSVPNENAETNASVNTPAQNRTFESVESVFLQWSESLVDMTQLNIYAPENYGELVDSWTDAQEIYTALLANPELINKDYSIFSSQTYAQAFDEHIATVQQNYDAIGSLKEKADSILAVAIEQVEYLDYLEAKTLFPSSYNRLYSDYSELFSYVLLDELENAQEEQVSFLNEAKKLEIKVMRHKFVEPLNTQLELLIDEDFDEVVPLTIAKATAQIKLTENEISSNPRAIEAIEESVAKAEFELDHVRSVAQEVKLIASVDNEEFEQVVLDMENRLLAISKVIDGGDYRNKALNQQSESIVASIGTLKVADKTEDLLSQIEKLTAQVTKLEGENKEFANQLGEASKQSEMLVKQVDRSDAHISSLEALVSSLKNVDNKVVTDSDIVPVESSLEPKPENSTELLTPEVQQKDAV